MVITFAISTFGIPSLILIATYYKLLVLIWYFAFALIINNIVKVKVLKYPIIN